MWENINSIDGSCSGPSLCCECSKTHTLLPKTEPKHLLGITYVVLIHLYCETIVDNRTVSIGTDTTSSAPLLVTLHGENASDFNNEYRKLTVHVMYRFYIYCITALSKCVHFSLTDISKGCVIGKSTL